MDRSNRANPTEHVSTTGLPVEVAASPDGAGSGAGVADFGDSALVVRLKAGENRAYEDVIRELGGRMLATATRMLGNEDDAREAVQDAFLSAFRNIATFDEKSKFGTWLHRILINACLMKLRTRRRKPSVSLDEVAERMSDGNRSGVPIASWRERSAEDLDEETRARVRDEIEELPDEYRTVIMLRDIEDLNTEETAAVLEISVSAVKTRLHRARLALRERLTKYFGDDARGALEGVRP